MKKSSHLTDTQEWWIALLQWLLIVLMVVIEDYKLKQVD